MDVSELCGWAPYLADYAGTESWIKLNGKVESAYENATVFPPRDQLFTALRLTPPDAVRVIILGQDPYHEPGQAHGLAFSVADGTRFPPSLQNIYKELRSDCGTDAPASGNLSAWAKQGVLLLNTVLTVECGKANSHKDFGWQEFTDAVLSTTAGFPQPIAYILWGSQAQKKEALLLPASGPRLILSGPHPSPLSAYRGFFGSRPFSKVNRFLEEHSEKPISWTMQEGAECADL